MFDSKGEAKAKPSADEKGHAEVTLRVVDKDNKPVATEKVTAPVTKGKKQ
jgi:hypothetical protein